MTQPELDSEQQGERLQRIRDLCRLKPYGFGNTGLNKERQTAEWLSRPQSASAAFQDSSVRTGSEVAIQLTVTQPITFLRARRETR
jgi:hypothetical protein